jgi:ABC-2 type transport system permease protein
MTVFLFALKRSFRKPLNILLIGVLPLGLLLIPRFGSWTMPMGFHLYGELVFFLAYSLIFTVSEDRNSGILTRIAAAPVSHFSYLGQILAAYTCIMVAQNGAMVLGGHLIYGGMLENPLRMLASYSVFSLASLSFCLALCSLVRLREVAYGSLSMLIIFFAALGGSMVPVTMMPAFLKRLAMISPIYWLHVALGAVPGTEGQFMLSLAVLLLFALVFLLAGSKRRMVS